jgi:Na+/H+ antiporter NhaD/arsenite permease-like protein
MPTDISIVLPVHNEEKNIGSLLAEIVAVPGNRESIWEAIPDFDVVFFLIGMFGIVAGVEKSGLLGYMMYRALSPFKNQRASISS